MENLDLKVEQLKVDSLGEAKISSPLKLSTVYGDSIANYVRDSESIVFYRSKNEILDRLKNKKPLLSFEAAGPRQKIYFDPSKTRAGVVTCGGLCPGINNVIRSIVMSLYYRYNLKTVFATGLGVSFRSTAKNRSILPLNM